MSDGWTATGSPAGAADGKSGVAGADCRASEEAAKKKGAIADGPVLNRFCGLTAPIPRQVYLGAPRALFITGEVIKNRFLNRLSSPIKLFRVSPTKRQTTMYRVNPFRALAPLHYSHNEFPC